MDSSAARSSSTLMVPLPAWAESRGALALASASRQPLGAAAQGLLAAQRLAAVAAYHDPCRQPNFYTLPPFTILVEQRERLAGEDDLLGRELSRFRHFHAFSLTIG
jgi:hypothetical protein